MTSVARTESHAQPCPNKTLRATASTIPIRIALSKGLRLRIAQSFQMVSRTVGANCLRSITWAEEYEKLFLAQAR